MKDVLESFHQKLIFVKFHTISPEKDEETGTYYPKVSLIQVGYISKNFELNIEVARKFEPFRFNKSWIKYRRTNGAFAGKCQGDRLYTMNYEVCIKDPTLLLLLKNIWKKESTMTNF